MRTDGGAYIEARIVIVTIIISYHDPQVRSAQSS